MFPITSFGDRPGAGNIIPPTGDRGDLITGTIITVITIIITIITTDISVGGTPIATRFGKHIIMAVVTDHGR